MACEPANSPVTSEMLEEQKMEMCILYPEADAASMKRKLKLVWNCATMADIRGKAK